MLGTLEGALRTPGRWVLSVSEDSLSILETALVAFLTALSYCPLFVQVQILSMQSLGCVVCVFRGWFLRRNEVNECLA